MGGAVEAGAVVGEVPVARDINFDAFVIGLISPKSIFTLHDVGLNFTISKDGSDPSIATDSAKSVILIVYTFIDRTNTFGFDVGLEDVASLGTQGSGIESSVIEDNFGNHISTGVFNVGGDHSLKDLVDCRGNAYSIIEDVWISALVASQSVS